MRFVHHNQVPVDMQDVFVKRNARLAVSAGFAIIKNGFSGLERRVFVDGAAVLIDHHSAVQPRLPCGFAHERESGAQKMQQRLAVELFIVRQHQIARLHAVEEGQGIFRFHAAHFTEKRRQYIIAFSVVQAAFEVQAAFLLKGCLWRRI